MTTDSSFARVMSRRRSGDKDAAAEVFRRFVRRLIGLASRQFDDRIRSKEDPEDVVLSVLKSFFQRDDSTPYDLEDWEGLWSLLARITVCKCINRNEFWNADLRDVGREVVPVAETSEGEWREAIARGPTVEQAVVLAETLELLVSQLGPGQRKIAELCFEGHSHAEISALCSCSERTVRRVVAWIRDWFQRYEADDSGV
jgi:RNA polymerase sigma-70 factor (ECF subfamily)